MCADTSKPWTFILALLTVGGLGCNFPVHWWPADNTTPPADEPVAVSSPTEPVSRPDANRDLRLFGYGDRARDVVFHGKAAVDIRQHTTVSEGADFDPDVGPAGKLLVFASTRHARHSHLYLKPVKGATLTQITDGAANDVQPCFDPTGKRVAFASDRGGQWDIWVIDSDGRNPVQITTSPAAELHPSWSPDGRNLVFCRIDSANGNGELWVVGLENPGIKRLIGEGLFPDWSPAGDKIVYQRSRERGSRWFSIWTLDIQDDEVLYPTEIVSRRDAALISPVWAPDGAQIAFTLVSPPSRGGEPRVDGGGMSDVAVVDTDGRALQRLTEGRGENFSPAWSVDGRIYFTARHNEKETIWSVRPFRPTMLEEPTITTENRRAASVVDVKTGG